MKFKKTILSLITFALAFTISSPVLAANSESYSADHYSETSDETTIDQNIKTATLRLRNEVSGTNAEQDKKFTFIITLTNNGTGVNKVFKCSNYSEPSIIFNNGKATVNLANNEEILISGIPLGYAVSIDQNFEIGYRTNPYSRHAYGSVVGNLSATFKNIKTTSAQSETDTPSLPTKTPEKIPSNTIQDNIKTVNLTFRHVTTGAGADAEKRFVYALTISKDGSKVTGSYAYTGTNIGTGTGTVAFSSEGKIGFTMKDGQTLTIQGLPAGTSYTIEKIGPDNEYEFKKSPADGLINDNTTVILVNTKKENKNKQAATAIKKSTQTITNTKKPVAIHKKVIKVKKVKLSKKKVTLKKGKTYKIKAKVSPKNATNKKLTYKSSNKKIATVSKTGKIKAKKKGKCTITVTSKDGMKKAKLKVTVK